jgi:hypothetical protein
MMGASVGAALLALLASVDGATADWQAALFGGKGARQPKSIHYRARVVDRADKVHIVEAWREPEKLRRSSDGVLDLYASRQGSAVSTVLVDRRSGQVVRSDQDALLRAGHIEAWNELAYVLVRPAGVVDLRRAGAPRHVAGAACQPYRVRRGDGKAFAFCWSARLRLPLEITSTEGRSAFVVEFVEERRAPDGVFSAPAAAVTDRTDDD